MNTAWTSCTDDTAPTDPTKEVAIISDKNNESTVTIKKVDYKDFFKVNDTYVKVNKVKD
jgi:hypothetical protein